GQILDASFAAARDIVALAFELAALGDRRDGGRDIRCVYEIARVVRTTLQQERAGRRRARLHSRVPDHLPLQARAKGREDAQRSRPEPEQPRMLFDNDLTEPLMPTVGGDWRDRRILVDRKLLRIAINGGARQVKIDRRRAAPAQIIENAVAQQRAALKVGEW